VGVEDAMRRYEDSFGDPELRDEDDPTMQEEMFILYRDMGWTPENFPDAEYAARYREWLRTAPPDEE
jgi:hypothetical protein